MVQIQLINMKGVTIEYDNKLGTESDMLKRFHPEFSRLKDSLDDLGLSFRSFDIMVKNEDKFIRWILDGFFPGYRLKDARMRGHKEPGHPDFILEKYENGEQKLIYVELKRNGDTLLMSQLEWFVNHRDSRIYILRLEYEKNSLSSVPLFSKTDYGGYID